MHDLIDTEFLQNISKVYKSLQTKKIVFRKRMTILGSHNCVPGERMGSCEEYEGGRGTYQRAGFIYSSRIGKINYTQVKGKKTLIDIVRDNEPPVPSIGAIVTCKVIQVTQKYARCVIYAFDGRATR